MKVSAGLVSKVPVVMVEGEMGAYSAGGLQEAIREVTGREGSQVIIVDLEHCTYIDSAGLAVLFSLVSGAREKGGRVAVVRPSTQVLRILQLTRLTDERGFQIFTDQESAQAASASL